MKWHAGRMILALAKHFDWYQNTMMTEWFVDGGQADLIFVTRAGYLTEIEIKISLSDWNADQTKKKFQLPRPHVSRFFYAVPEPLIDRVPEWVSEEVGLLAVVERPTYDSVREIRPAKRKKSVPLRGDEIARIYRNGHARMWSRELGRLARNRANT